MHPLKDMELSENSMPGRENASTASRTDAQLSEAVRDAVILLEGSQRQDGFREQLEDLIVLARSARCNAIADRIKHVFCVEPGESGNDWRIGEVADYLETFSETTPDTWFEEEAIVRALALASGCRDALDRLRSSGIMI